MAADLTDTLNVLYDLVERKIITTLTVILYVYLKIHTGEILPYSDLAKTLNTHKETIRRHVEVLEHFDLVERKKVSRSYKIKADVIREKSCLSPFLSYSYNTSTSPREHKEVAKLARAVTPILNYNNSRYSYASGRRAANFEDDEDWLEAKKVLTHHFPDAREISALRLGERRFMKLCGYMMDGLPLEIYCEWYAEEKLDRLGFTWNMFLLNSMVAEFYDKREDFESARAHLTTSSSQMKEKHAKGAKADKAWIRNMTGGRE